MGDAAVDFFLETLKQLITSSKLGAVIATKHELQSLEEKIKYLREFLKDTEKKRNEHSEVMKLVMEIRNVVYEAENSVERSVIDAIDLDTFARLPPSRTVWKRLLRGGLKLLLTWCHARELKHDLVIVKMEIKTLTTKVKQIYNENIYDINGVAVQKFKHPSARSGGGSSPAGGSNTSKVVKEKVVVGFDEEVVKLLEKLCDGTDKPLEIVTIIGAGGVGKTTLVREVFDHPVTLGTFEIRAWVDVSQDYGKTTTKKHLLIRVLKSTIPENDHEDYENSSEDMLGEKVLKSLKGRKYLIVMDDIWGIEAWNDIQRSYPKERKGSKVLFTSRQPVQLDCVSHYLNPLPKHESWELLQKKVFGMNCCPPKLVNMGVKIAEKCEGLPLAIIAIAGILAKEDKTIDVWEEVAEHLSSIIADKDTGCIEILELSYNHLPLHLKACFLHIGAFLENSEIRVRELLWLWIAEGFIRPSEEGKSLEAIAKDYLIDLVDRNLVMVARKSSLGGVKACRIHDLLRVFCLKKAKDDNFLVQIYDDDSFSPSATNKLHRLVITSQFFHKFFLRPHAPNLRSFRCLHMPNSSYLPSELNLSFFVENFGSCRVLSFISAECRGEIGKDDLVHLRYLAVRIPRTCLFFPISNLLNLQTLDLQVLWLVDFIQLPWDIFKMVKLRHLYSKKGVFAFHIFKGPKAFMFDDSTKLDSLQTLHRICACYYCQRFLETTPNLRKLGLAKKVGSASMVPDLKFLKCLETLNLAFVTLTAELKLPLTIKRLTLSSTYLEWENLSILQNLPSLEVLKLLGNACQGRVWNTSGEGFPQLKYLRLSNMKEIEHWNASEDQFVRLEVLVLDHCTCLQRIPIDFANLNELREIKLLGCTWSAEKLAREILEDLRDRNGNDDCLNLLAKFNHEDS